MDIAEIHRRCEANVSLFSATDDELRAAFNASTREIHRYIITRELAARAKHQRQVERHRAQQGRRKPALPKEDRWIGIILGTHDEFGKPRNDKEARL